MTFNFKPNKDYATLNNWQAGFLCACVFVYMCVCVCVCMFVCVAHSPLSSGEKEAGIFFADVQFVRVDCS